VQRRKVARKTGESKPKRTFSRCLPTCNPLPSPFLSSSLRLCTFAFTSSLLCVRVCVHVGWTRKKISRLAA
jgi:hypothetical protein